MRNVGTSLLLILTVASVAHAQPAELSQHERAYAKGLAEALGPASRVERVGFLWSPLSDEVGVMGSAPERESGAAPLRVSGLRLDLAGVTVRRLKLEDLEAARLFAGSSKLGAEGPVVAELRGDQVIFVHGEPVRDAAFARRALDAAWRGLPVAAPAEATFAHLGDTDIVVSTTTHQGPIAAPILSSFRVAAAKAAEQPQTGYRAVLYGPEDVSFEFTHGGAKGLTSRIHADDAARAWIWTTREPTRAGAMARYLEVLTGAVSERDQSRPRDGLNDVLSRTHGGSRGSIALADGGGPTTPAADALVEAASRQVRAEIDAALRGTSDLSKDLEQELEAARAGTRVVDRPLGE